MNFHFNFQCPACDRPLAEERKINESYVCECGWMTSPSRLHIKKRASNGPIPMILFGLLILGSFIHVIQWDKYSLAIVPLKISQWMQKLTPTDLAKMADICFERKRHVCLEESLSLWSNLEPNNLKLLHRLGEHQIHQKKYDHAAKTYSRHFQSIPSKQSPAKVIDPKHEAEMAHSYALALEKIGQLPKAIHFQRLSLQKLRALQSPTRAPVEYSRTYVRLLMAHQEWNTAQRWIEAYRKTSPAASLFMDRELKEIERKQTRSIANVSKES